MLTLTTIVALLLSIRMITTGSIGYGVAVLLITLFFQFMIYIINWISSDMDEL